METKERILHEALALFSERGYDGVSMRQIAAVGIQADSPCIAITPAKSTSSEPFWNLPRSVLPKQCIRSDWQQTGRKASWS